jgi:beta-barrel assembly-enhancing protease
MLFLGGVRVMLKRSFHSLASILLVTLSIHSAHAVSESQLPDIGTAGVAALSIDREVEFGNAFMRIARAQLPVIDDPVLNEYLGDLGQQLVSHANDVRFPFTFFLIQDETINAAAFLGGKVKVHTGLFLNADTESELASVLAHEISHVTQRHIARYMEAQTQQAPVTIAGLVGSVALAILNPAVGIAALQTTMGLQVQSAINYTRDNEYEADRIGMQLLFDAGFQPMDMATFFQKLAAEYRYASKPPEMLLTHPLPETRIAEARNRAANFPRQAIHDETDFLFAKARIQVRFSRETPDAMLSYFEHQISRKGNQSHLLYGKALALLALNRAQDAATIINGLAQRYPDDLFILDTQTDIDMVNQHVEQATKRLETMRTRLPENSVVIFNLASCYMQQHQFQKAAKLLDLYVRANPESDLGWKTLVSVYQQTGDETNLHLAYAESKALSGDYLRAMDELNLARATSSNKLVLARIDARLVQLEEAKRLDESLRQ